YPELRERFQKFVAARPELTAFIHDPAKPGHAGRQLAAVLNESKLRRVLAKMLDENEFLSPYGIRALSRYHVEHPYVFRVGFQENPHWRDYLLFYEYFHGDNGAGLGASHQTGWTGIIARLMHVFATSTAEQFLELGRAAAITEVEPAPRGQSKEVTPSRKL